MPESPSKGPPPKSSSGARGPTSMSAPDSRDAKRRRLDAAANTLSKPFRSPLLTSTPRSTNTTPSPTKSTASTAGSPPPTPSPTASVPPVLGPRRRRPSVRPFTMQQQPPADPELAELYKRQSALEAKLRSKRALVDTATQALNIETAADGHGEEKLQSLIEKWRGAAQKAADVLFGITSQRVANSGPGGWKEMIRKRGWDDEDKPAPPADLGDEDDEEFTMGIMLKTLNIDLDLIGYDGERDCWK